MAQIGEVRGSAELIRDVCVCSGQVVRGQALGLPPVLWKSPWSPGTREMCRPGAAAQPPWEVGREGVSCGILTLAAGP